MIYLVESKTIARTVQAVISANSEIEAKIAATANYKFDNVDINSLVVTELNNNTKPDIILLK